MVPNKRTRNNGHKVNYRKFHLTRRKHFFTVKMLKHSKRLPREVVKSRSL